MSNDRKELLEALELAHSRRVALRDVLLMVELAYGGTFTDWTWRDSTPGVPALFVRTEGKHG